MSTFTSVLLVAIGILFLLLILFVIQYKRCPSDKILVVYGKTGQGASKCIHGGAAFVVPVFQSYQFLDLTPLSIEVNLTGALSRQNIRMDVPSRFTVGISNEPGIMENAANRLLGLKMESIRDLAQDIIVGQMRLVIATMDIEEINADRDKFVENVYTNVGSELKKIGLNLINVNVTDIHDESGYIEALGKEAAAQAVNQARKLVAEKTRDGSIGEAKAQQEERVEVANSEATAKVGEAEANAQSVEGENLAKITVANSEAKRREREAEANSLAAAGVAKIKQEERIQVANAEAQAKVGEAEANAQAVEGENLAKITIANSEAQRREKEAEANSRATAAEKIQKAKALEEAYKAEKEAEEARAQREMAQKQADIIVQAEIEKQKAVIKAQAEAERIRELAKGDADAILAKRQAEAMGLFEILSKQAEGFDKIVKAANGEAREAVLLMIADKLPELVELQVEAIKNIKIDKVTVWEGGGGNGHGEGTSTSRFISGLYQSMPPLAELFQMAGLELPDYLAKKQQEEVEVEIIKENGKEEEGIES
ncbi:MAG: SPFH domain-containing protein [Bacteroidota bacterium]